MHPISQHAIQKDCFAIFKVKVTARAPKIKIWLSLLKYYIFWTVDRFAPSNRLMVNHHKPLVVVSITATIQIFSYLVDIFWTTFCTQTWYIVINWDILQQNWVAVFKVIESNTTFCYISTADTFASRFCLIPHHHMLNCLVRKVYFSVFSFRSQQGFQNFIKCLSKWHFWRWTVSTIVRDRAFN